MYKPIEIQLYDNLETSYTLQDLFSSVKYDIIYTMSTEDREILRMIFSTDIKYLNVLREYIIAKLKILPEKTLTVVDKEKIKKILLDRYYVKREQIRKCYLQMTKKKK